MTDKQKFYNHIWIYDIPTSEEDQSFIQEHYASVAPQMAHSAILLGNLVYLFNQYENYLGAIEDQPERKYFIPYHQQNLQTDSQLSMFIEIDATGYETKKFHVHTGLYQNPINERFVYVKLHDECSFVRTWGKTGLILTKPNGESFVAYVHEIAHIKDM